MQESLEQFRRTMLFDCQYDDTIEEVRVLAQVTGAEHLPVLARGELVGLLSLGCLGLERRDVLVEERMQPPLTLSFDHRCSDALDLMNATGAPAVLLMEDVQARGLVTRGEITNRNAPDGYRSETPYCRCCGTTKALRTAPDGKTLCVDCIRQARLHMGSWPVSGELAAPV